MRIEGTFRNQDNQSFPNSCVEAFGAVLKDKASYMVDKINSQTGSFCPQTPEVSTSNDATDVSIEGIEVSYLQSKPYTWPYNDLRNFIHCIILIHFRTILPCKSCI